MHDTLPMLTQNPSLVWAPNPEGAWAIVLVGHVIGFCGMGFPTSLAAPHISYFVPPIPYIKISNRRLGPRGWVGLAWPKKMRSP
jgi:hypothetical protein